MDPFASRGHFNIFIWSQDHACMKCPATSQLTAVTSAFLSDRNLHGDTGPKSGYKGTWNETFFKQPETKWKHLLMRFVLDQRPPAIGLQAQRCKHLDIKSRCLVAIQCAFHSQEHTIKSPWSGHPHFSGEMQLPGWRIAFTAVSCCLLGPGLEFHRYQEFSLVKSNLLKWKIQHLGRLETPWN